MPATLQVYKSYNPSAGWVPAQVMQVLPQGIVVHCQGAQAPDHAMINNPTIHVHMH